MASNPIPRKWTFEEYLAYEQESDMKFEYIDGDIYMMVGGSENYSLITGNTFMAVGQQAKTKGCRMHTSDLRVKISDTKFVYPDFSVICGQAEFDDDNHTTLTNPTMCVEVMLPSSVGYDKNLKADFYRSVPSLQHYLIIDQHTVYARLYTRQDNGWLLQEFAEMRDKINLRAIDIELVLADIYEDVILDDGDE